jgi:phosphotransferase system HPr-like phosphotransfer protein
LGYNGEWADGKEIMDILALGAGPESLLVVETEGEDGEAALDALSRFLLVDSKVL